MEYYYCECKSLNCSHKPLECKNTGNYDYPLYLCPDCEEVIKEEEENGYFRYPPYIEFKFNIGRRISIGFQSSPWFHFIIYFFGMGFGKSYNYNGNRCFRIWISFWPTYPLEEGAYIMKYNLDKEWKF